jgi:hypothetical protein
MARSYGHIMSAIWNDSDFRALSGAAQRVYLMLITQADITSAGTLSLTIKRWSSYAADTPSDALRDALSELMEERYVVIDGATEELLVRKFVKWDGGWSNSKRLPAIRAAATTVSSGKLRAALAIELDALGVSHALSDALSDGLPDTPRVVVTEVSIDPQPSTLNREPSPIRTDGPYRGRCRKHPGGTDEPCGECRADRLGHESRAVLAESQKRTALQRNDQAMTQLDADLAAPRDVRAFTAARAAFETARRPTEVTA